MVTAAAPQPHPPRHVFMWLELRCNLQCSHCNIWQSKTQDPGLSLADRQLIVRRLRDYYDGPFTLNLLGGELLLLDDVYDLVAYCSELGVQSTITSNGTLITAKIAQRLVEVGLTHLSISLNSHRAAVHDETRGVPGTYARAVRGLESVAAARDGHPKLWVNVLVMRQNIADLPTMARWADEIGLDGITFQPITPPHIFSPHGVHTSISRFINLASLDALIERFRRRDQRWFEANEFWPDPAQATRSFEQLLELQAEGLPIGNSAADLERLILYFNDPQRALSSGRCTAGEALTISEIGELKHCLGEPSLGDARTVDLAARLESRQAAAIRQRILGCNRSCKILPCNKEDFFF